MKYKELDIEVIRSKRKSIALEVHEDLHVKVRVPMRMPQYQILEFVNEKEAWIRRHLQKMRKRQEALPEVQSSMEYTEGEIAYLVQKAKEVIPLRVAFYAQKMGVTYGRITIRNQKTRWGSCSQKGNLNFNCRLMKMPIEIVDYVVVHELCHRKQMNHSNLFWNEVENVMPDYLERRQWLKEKGRYY